MNTICLAVVAFLAACSAEVTDPTVTVTPADCRSAAINGMLEVGCWGYRECKDNVVHTHMCPTGNVLVQTTLQCVPSGTSNTVCDPIGCGSKPDAMYTSMVDHCHSYYRCYGSINIGQFYCPAFLVFNDKIQSCDFPSNVPVPCGTAPIKP